VPCRAVPGVALTDSDMQRSEWNMRRHDKVKHTESVNTSQLIAETSLHWNTATNTQYTTTH